MKHFKAILSYKGTGYQGLQIQPGNVKTIQGEIHKALEKMAPGKEYRFLASGRTDAGVHAFAQVVKLSVSFDIEASSLLKALNRSLPCDINFKAIEDSDEKFHPIGDALSKEYVYYFAVAKFEDPLSAERLTHYPYELNINDMQKACDLFVGEHDFTHFHTIGSNVKTTVRTISHCELKPVNISFGEEVLAYELRVAGSGFLKQMVRMIMGSLFELGRGQLSFKDLESLLNNPQTNQKKPPVAPPQGLHLWRVFY